MTNDLMYLSLARVEFNPLPENKILHWSKFKQIVDDILKSSTQSRLLTTLMERLFENIVGKEENAGNQHFLLFPHCFLLFTKQISTFESH